MKSKSIFLSSFFISLFFSTCSLFPSFATNESRSKKTTKKEIGVNSLDLKNVYLTSQVSSPDSVVIFFGDDNLGNVYENNGFIFFGDSVIYRRWTYRESNVDSVIELYKVPEVYQKKIKELSTHVLKNKVSWNSSDVWAYKLYGSMTFYLDGKYPQSMTQYNSPGDAVDSLFRTIMNLHSDIQLLSPSKTLYNTRINILTKEVKTEDFARLTLQINGKIFEVENNRISLRYLYKSIPEFYITENEVSHIHNLFKDALPIVYSNDVDNVILAGPPTNLSLFLDDKIVFLTYLHSDEQSL